MCVFEFGAVGCQRLPGAAEMQGSSHLSAPHDHNHGVHIVACIVLPVILLLYYVLCLCNTNGHFVLVVFLFNGGLNYCFVTKLKNRNMLRTSLILAQLY